MTFTIQSKKYSKAPPLASKQAWQRLKQRPDLTVHNSICIPMQAKERGKRASKGASNRVKINAWEASDEADFK